MTKVNDINKSIEALEAKEKETENFIDKLSKKQTFSLILDKNSTPKMRSLTTLQRKLLKWKETLK